MKELTFYLKLIRFGLKYHPKICQIEELYGIKFFSSNQKIMSYIGKKRNKLGLSWAKLRLARVKMSLVLIGWGFDFRA